MPREYFSLRCSGCRRYNYTGLKNKKTHTEALELSKYCKFCRGHRDHKEHKR